MIEVKSAILLGDLFHVVIVPDFTLPEAWAFMLCKHLPTIMENWKQDHPERNSYFYRLYIKFQGCRKWPWTWWGRWKGQGHRPHHPDHGKWRKACINICEHILKFPSCVLVRVPINNNNYEQPIALFVIILAKNTFTNHHGVI